MCAETLNDTHFETEGVPFSNGPVRVKDIFYIPTVLQRELIAIN